MAPQPTAALLPIAAPEPQQRQQRQPRSTPAAYETLPTMAPEPTAALLPTAAPERTTRLPPLPDPLTALALPTLGVAGDVLAASHAVPDAVQTGAEASPPLLHVNVRRANVSGAGAGGGAAGRMTHGAARQPLAATVACCAAAVVVRGEGGEGGESSPGGSAGALEELRLLEERGSEAGAGAGAGVDAEGEDDLGAAAAEDEWPGAQSLRSAAEAELTRKILPSRKAAQRSGGGGGGEQGEEPPEVDAVREEMVRVMLGSRHGVNLLAVPELPEVRVQSREQRLLAEAAEQLREVDDSEDVGEIARRRHTCRLAPTETVT